MSETTGQPARTFFPELKGKLGFGLMRLPMTGDRVDFAQTVQMVDAYLAAGFCYFDTAHGYIPGQSETAVRTCWRGAPADPVHGLPLLYGQLPDGDPDSGYPASAQPAHDVSFPGTGGVLYTRTDERERQGVRLYRLRPMRRRLSAAS